MRLTSFQSILPWVLIGATVIASAVYFSVRQPDSPADDVPDSSNPRTIIPVTTSDGPNFDDDLWSSEEVAEQIQSALNEFKSFLSGKSPSEVVRPYVTASVELRYPDPGSMELLHQDQLVSVRRQAQSGSSTVVQAHDFSSQLEELLRKRSGSTPQNIALKIAGIQIADDEARTTVRCEASFRLSDQSIQQTSTWSCVWKLSNSSSAPPQLNSISVSNLEEATLTAPDGKLFADATASAFQGVDAYATQITPGIPFWLARIPKELISQFGHHGLALGDVNADGLDDLYVCDAGGLPNRLYLQRSDGTGRLVDVSSESGVDFLDDTVGALLIDLDNDGDQDLVVGTDPFLQLAENDGTGHFQVRSRMDLETDTFSLTAADYDGDGLLDLYVCGYDMRRRNPTEQGLPFPLPYHNAQNGAPNRLLKNTGSFQFRDVTSEVGLDTENRRFSMAASWEDFDNDGDLDLYVANDFGPNNLYRNDGGSFIDVARQAAVVDHGSGMSVSWADFDRDGWMDLYVGNMFSAAGNRITYQDRFQQGVSEITTQHLQRMARGNTLFRNRSSSNSTQFEDISLQAGVAMGRWAWASRFVDLQNNGWPDLLISNGYLTNHKIEDL